MWRNEIAAPFRYTVFPSNYTGNIFNGVLSQLYLFIVHINAKQKVEFLGDEGTSRNNVSP